MSFKNRIEFWLLLTSLLVWRTQSFGQGIIRGFVRDASNGESLPFANVVLVGTSYGAASDDKGYYVVHRVPPGRYEITASMMGYKKATKNVTVLAGQTATINFSLEPDVLEFEAVVKTAQRERFEREVAISTQSLSPRELKVAPAIAETDLFRTLQLLPGVITQSDYSSALIVRGGSPDQNLVLLDGITVYNPYHLGGFFSTFNTDAIKQAEIMTGGFPAEYGGRLSSVLDVTNKEGNSKEFAGAGNISLISSKMFLEGPLPRGSWFLAGRRTYFDILYETYQKLRHKKERFPYYFYDFQGKINLDLSENNRLTLSGFYGDDVIDLDELIEDEEDEATDNESFNINLDAGWGNRTTSLKWRYIFGPKLFSEMLLATSKFRFDTDMKLKFTREEDDTLRTNSMGINVADKILDYTFKWNVSYFASENHQLKFGTEYNRLDFSVFVQLFFDEHKFKLLDMHNRPHIAAFYAQDRWQVSPRLALQPGFRLNYYNLGRRWRIEPRLGWRYKLQENLALKGSFGQYHQFLSTGNSEEENFRIIDFWYPIPENKLPIKATEYVLGIEQWLPYTLILTAEIYYKKFDHLLEINEQGDEFDDTDDFEEGDGFSLGFELLLKKSIGNLYGWLGYSYAYTKRTIAGQTYFPKYDKRHNFNIVANYRPGKNWTFSALWSYGSGFPYTNVIGKWFKVDDAEVLIHHDWDIQEDPDKTKEIKSPRNSLRYPAYHRLDVSATKKFDFRSWNFSLYFQIVNAYNRHNVFQYFFDHQANPSKRYSFPMFPFIPTFGVNFEF